jgi:anti-anti-sigma factor
MYSVEPSADTTIIHVHTDLDSASSVTLDSLIRLAENGGLQRIIVAIATGKYCYSAGLSVLALANLRLGSKLIVVVPELSRFRRTIELTGLSKLLSIAPSIQSALDARFVPAH